MKQDRKTQRKLEVWRDRYGKAKSAYSEQLQAFSEREELYKGVHKLPKLYKNVKDGREPEESVHCWNIVAENIESEVDSTIPMPKVTARRAKNEGLAKTVERMLRNELDRLPMEEINDMAERTVPIQGGVPILVEWDTESRDHNHVGDNSVMMLHPKEFIPQPGVYGSVEDMDWMFLVLPQTRGYILRRYGVDVSTESEEEPEVRGDEASTEDDMVTQYIACFRNTNGGIGRFSWVGDTVLEDMEDYQARRLRRCARCGAIENSESMILNRATEDGVYPEGAETEKKPEKGVCPYCGGREWKESEEEYEELITPVMIGGANGREIGGTMAALDENGNAVMQAAERIPYFKPDRYPVILQKNISVFGQLLGESDAEKIKDQQYTVNRMEQKIIERITKAGTRVTLPEDTNLSIDPKDGDVWRLRNAADKAMIDVYQFEGNLQWEMAYLSQVYEESRRILGITDSFQGRNDSTAKSGVAKQFAAAQSAGRLESKRKLKQAAYQRIYEALFFNKLAYCDEKTPIVYTDENGRQQYDSFNRYDFLEQDESGEWHYITDFIFACDESSGLAANRQQMWQEITAQFTAGTFGNPQSLETLILYWTRMEQEHYPGAAQTKAYLENQLRQQQAVAEQQMQMQQQMQERANAEALMAARQDALNEASIN